MTAAVPRLTVHADRLHLQREGLVMLQLPLPPATPGRGTAVDWPGALRALAAAAGAVTLARVEVEIDAAHARLFVLPYHDALHAESRWAGYAHSRFEALFGEPADAWALRVVPERPPRPRLAVALPAPLLDGLRGAFGSGLRSVRVGALGRLDTLRAREARFTGAAVEGGARHLVVSLFERGVLQRLRQRHAAALADELWSVLRVEWAALGHEGPLPALAVGPGLPADAPWSALAQRVLALD
jgi:hypothetical protein